MPKQEPNKFAYMRSAQYETTREAASMKSERSLLCQPLNSQCMYILQNQRRKTLLQGILAANDAERAVEMGCDGIIVSNHGGRQLDHTPASLDVLPSIAIAVNGRIPIWVVSP